MNKDPNSCKKPHVPIPKTATPDLTPLLHDEAHFAPAPLVLAACSWLRMRRRRYLFLLLCSPILLPFLCAIFPLLCAAEFCVRICRGRRRGKAAGRQSREEEERLRGCEEGNGCNNEGEEREVGLLQRYLEDQLMLVGSVYDCGDDRDPDALDCRVPLLS